MVVICNTITGFKKTIVPEQIRFEPFSFLGLLWQWNEDKQLLIDPFLIIHRTNKDSFLRHFAQHQNIFISAGNIIRQNDSEMIECFNHWYESTKIH